MSDWSSLRGENVARGESGRVADRAILECGLLVLLVHCWSAPCVVSQGPVMLENNRWWCGNDSDSEGGGERGVKQTKNQPRFFLAT